jgi:O-antigen ligase
VRDVTFWRLGVCVALASAALRSGGLGFLLGDLAWYALQFGPLLLLGLAHTVAMIRSKGPRPSRTALAVITAAAALVGVAALSAIGASEPGQTLRQVALLAVVFLFLLTTYAHRWSRDGALDGDLLTVFVVGVGLQTLGLVGFVSGQAWAIGDYGRLVGVTPNANYAGISCAVLVALSFHFRESWTKVAALFPLTALILSDSRGSTLGLMVGLLAMLVLSPAIRGNMFARIWAIAIILILPIVFGLRSLRVIGGVPARFPVDTPAASVPGLSPPSAPDISSGRFDIYAAYLQRWAQQPWLGGGYRTSQVQLNGQLFEAHNVYLSVLVEMGVLGALVFAALLVATFRSAASGAALIGAASTALSVELTESSLFGLGGPTAIMSWLVLFGWAASGLAGKSPGQAAAEIGPAAPG